jgi:hypothetical protein
MSFTEFDDEGGDSSFLNFHSRSNYAVKITQKWPKNTARHKISEKQENRPKITQKRFSGKNNRTGRCSEKITHAI